jgi:glycine hydroxymethyltransferase
MNPSGIRVGTPAVTTRGLKEEEMKLIVAWIDEALQDKEDENKLSVLKKKVKELCDRFPIPTK